MPSEPVLAIESGRFGTVATISTTKISNGVTRKGRAPELRTMRLVAMTGYDAEADQQRTRTAGFDAHLVKPVEIDRLLAVLEGR